MLDFFLHWGGWILVVLQILFALWKNPRFVDLMLHPTRCKLMHIPYHYYHGPSGLWNCRKCGACWEQNK